MNVEMEKDNFTENNYEFRTINHVHGVIEVHIHCRN